MTCFGSVRWRSSPGIRDAATVHVWANQLETLLHDHVSVAPLPDRLRAVQLITTAADFVVEVRLHPPEQRLFPSRKRLMVDDSDEEQTALDRGRRARPDSV